MRGEAGSSATLEVRGVSADYGGADVLRGVEIRMRPGQITALIGPNGAGKSTISRCISGLLRPSAGEIWLDGTRIDDMRPGRIASLGVCQVPEGRRLFGTQSVADNLLIGAWVRRRDRRGIHLDREEMFERFPVLAPRRNEMASSLSGGEAQILALAVALMSRPSILILDEPSLGLAPKLVHGILNGLVDLASEGVTVLLIEQLVHKALQVADWAYVVSNGSVVIDGPAAQLAEDERVRGVYLGIG